MNEVKKNSDDLLAKIAEVLKKHSETETFCIICKEDRSSVWLQCGGYSESQMNFEDALHHLEGYEKNNLHFSYKAEYAIKKNKILQKSWEVESLNRTLDQIANILNKAEN